MHNTYPADIYEQLFLRAPIGMALVSLQGEWLKTNQALCDLLGYTETELCKLHFKDVTHPEDVAVGDEQRSRLVAGTVNQVFIEKRYVKKDGTIIWVKLSIALTTLQDNTKYFIGHIQDIDETKLTSIKSTARNSELTKMNDLMIERELRMISLKKENRELVAQVANLQK